MMVSRSMEQRGTPRIQPFVAPCRILEGSRGHTGYLTDLSIRGARVSYEGAVLMPGAAVELEVKIGRKAARSRLHAEVKWVRPAARWGHSLGLTFHNLSAAERQALERVVADFRRRAEQLAS
jgi:hypothetical protein